MPRNVPLLILLSVIPALARAATEDSLPRRGFLGAALDTEGAAAERGVRIKEVFADASAAAAGLRPGDVVVRVDDQTLEGPGRLAALLGAVTRSRSGHTLTTTIRRDESEQTLPITMGELPRESSSAHDTIYDSVDAEGVRHRVILTLPRTPGPHAAMFFIQGLGCTSVEAPLQPLDPIRRLIDEVTDGGIATLRVEKSGCGDSQGPPCAEIDFQTELKGYRAALEYLRARDGVDPSKIFLFGHSMGGVFAPVLAEERSVAGIIVYGTIGAPLIQYFEDTNARQFPLMRYSGSMLEQELERSREFLRLFFAERLDPAQVIARSPDLRGHLRVRDGDDTHLFGRHYTFWHQLDALNLPTPWKAVSAPVLALWGTSDIAATREDHPLIADTVNAEHPGHAEFRELPNTGHGFEVSPSMADSFRNHMMGDFNPLLASTCVEWMKQRATSL